MSKEKSDDWFDDQLDEVFEREFEEAFDLAFENAAAASTSVNKEAMAASWDKVNTEIRKIKKRKNRIKRWQLAGIVAASIAIGATVFSTPLGIEAGTIMQRLMKIGDDVSLVFTGPQPDHSTALTVPPPEVLNDPYYNDTWQPNEAPDEVTVSDEHTLLLVELPEETAINNTSFVLNEFELPFTPTKTKHYLLLDEENPMYPENPYKSDEIDFEFYEGNEPKVTVAIKKMFPEDPNAQFGITMNFSGVPEEIRLEDGTEAVFYENGNYDQLVFRNHLAVVMIMGPLPKDDMLFIANSIQETNSFTMKP
ncbi:hypothetical protein M3231_12410 [Neobacillus mesonae]|nr:hypothetical protein [Neobacillus mesonae]